MKIETIDIDVLISDPENARTHDEKNIKAIMGSLKKFKQVEPLIVRRQNNVVIGGNGRLEAMKRLGYTEVSVHYVDTDDQLSKALALALNRTAELADWDMHTLGNILLDLKENDFDIASIGFESAELDDLIPDIDDNVVSEDKFEIVVTFKNDAEMEDLFQELRDRKFKVKAR